MHEQSKSTYFDKDILNFPFDIVCPKCHYPDFRQTQANGENNSQLSCVNCLTEYSIEDSFGNFIVGERFEDESDQECLCYEEESNQYTTEEFWIPLFRKIQSNRTEKLKILSIGCGIGREVDMLCDAGFDCVGIDNGNRAKVWHKRKYSNNLIMANGMHLPFKAKTFDVVFCGCVFPHVGVIGDSVNVTENYLQDRSMLAAEMCRVCSEEGEIVVGSPNRIFPFDLFHGRESGCYTPRYNRPDERFLLSAKDYRNLFSSAGCKQYELLPIKGYWGFVRSKNNLKGLLLSLPVRFVFNLVSLNYFKFLRSTIIVPWLVVSFRFKP